MIDETGRANLWTRLSTAIATLPQPPATPTMVVDLDTFEANARDLARRAGGIPIRVASKSIRVPGLVSRAQELTGFQGVLAYTLAEALWMFEQGVSSDIVLAYPTVDRESLERLSSVPNAHRAITLMVDDREHVKLIRTVAGRGAGPLRVAIDIDAGLRMGNQHVGPKRSPLYDPQDVVNLARQIVDTPDVELVGVMTYEGQVAGVPDEVPRQRAKSAVVRRLKSASVSQLRNRRDVIATRLGELADLKFWNAGGTGSLESSATDPVVTEVTAGSGLLCPTLFDHYQSFTSRPAAFFGLPVTRKPNPEMATVHGGGLIASGPAGDDRVPTPWAPPGLHLTGLEGVGEVQTPLTGHAAGMLRIGDLVWFRHAKSGEPFEHTNQAILVRGDEVVEVVRTYRGHGLSF